MILLSVLASPGVFKTTVVGFVEKFTSPSFRVGKVDGTIDSSTGAAMAGDEIFSVVIGASLVAEICGSRRSLTSSGSLPRTTPHP